mgnify:CR=1 FL=1
MDAGGVGAEGELWQVSSLLWLVLARRVPSRHSRLPGHNVAVLFYGAIEE